MKGHIDFTPAKVRHRLNVRIGTEDDLFVVLEGHSRGGVITLRLSGQDLAELKNAIKKIEKAQKIIRVADSGLKSVS